MEREILNNLLVKIEEFNQIKDLRNDKSNCVNHIISYYGMLKTKFPNSPEFQLARSAFSTIKVYHPELTKWCDNFMNQKEQSKENKKEESKEILDELLATVKKVNQIKDVKGDTFKFTNSINYILFCYRRLGKEFPNSSEFQLARAAISTIKTHHPMLTEWCDKLLNPGNKKIEEEAQKIVKLINVTINEFNQKNGNGMYFVEGCNQYIDTLSRYLIMLEKYKDYFDKVEYSKIVNLVNNEIGKAGGIIDYSESLDSSFGK